MSASLLFIVLVTMVVHLCHGELQYSVPEESPKFTVVANLAKDLSIDMPSMPNLDQGASSSSSSTIRITNWNEAGPRHFAINSSTGVLYVAIPPDREALCDTRPLCVVTLSISYGDRYDPVITSISVVLLDVNDNSPKFPREFVRWDVLENSKPHLTTKELLLAMDADVGNNGLIHYKLKNPQNVHFQLDTSRGSISSGAMNGLSEPTIPTLVLLSPLRWEKDRDHFTLTLWAEDSGSPPRHGELRIEIEVIDVNDNPPKFDKSKYTATVKEDLPKGSEILIISATDGDNGANANIHYRIADPRNDAETEASRMFGLYVREDKAHVMLQQVLDVDRSQRHQYEFQVEAKDNGHPALSATVPVIIRVLDVNDFVPEIAISFLTEQSLQQNRGYVMENVDRTFLGQVRVIDYDSGAGGMVQCRTDDSRFFLEELPTSGSGLGPSDDLAAMGNRKDFKLMSGHRFDRETTPSLAFHVICVDNNGLTSQQISGGAVQLTGTTEVRVSILDDNDERPVFTKQEYTFRVAENVPHVKEVPLQPPGNNQVQGTLIGNVSTVDKDVGENARVSYSLSSLDSTMDSFRIDEKGRLFITRPFDRESLSEDFIRVNVLASDGKFTSTALIKVFIVDENDCAPVFTRENYHFPVQENMKNVHIGDVKAEDRDTGPHAFLFYHLDTHRDIFNVDARTGRLSNVRPLDRESRSLYVFHVLAEDYPQGRINQRNTGTATITLTITDENDNRPKITRPINGQTIPVPYDAAAGHKLLSVIAEDEDEGENGTLQFYLQEPHEALEVDPNTGLMFLTTKPTQQLFPKPGINIQLVVTDMGKAVQLNSSISVRLSIDGGTSAMVTGPGSSDDSAQSPYRISPRYPLLMDRIIIVILATIFIILLVATVVLAVVIRRRHQFAHSAGRGGGVLRKGPGSHSQHHAGDPSVQSRDLYCLTSVNNRLDSSQGADSSTAPPGLLYQAHVRDPQGNTLVRHQHYTALNEDGNRQYYETCSHQSPHFLTHRNSQPTTGTVKGSTGFIPSNLSKSTESGQESFNSLVGEKFVTSTLTRCNARGMEPSPPPTSSLLYTSKFTSPNNLSSYSKPAFSDPTANSQYQTLHNSPRILPTTSGMSATAGPVHHYCDEDSGSPEKTRLTNGSSSSRPSALQSLLKSSSSQSVISPGKGQAPPPTTALYGETSFV